MRGPSASAAVLLVVVTSSGCAMNKVTLSTAPDPSAPLSQRDAYYAEHRALGIAGQPMGGGLAQDAFPFLQLANGKRVVDPLDILPAVGSESLAGAAAKKAADQQLFADLVMAGGTSAYIIGAASLLVGILPGAGFGAAGAALAIGGAGLFSLGIVGMFVGVDLYTQAQLERTSSFMLYDESLRRRLRLRTREEAGVAESRWHVEVPREPVKPSEPPQPMTDPSTP